jgi:hypothetical protein
MSFYISANDVFLSAILLYELYKTHFGSGICLSACLLVVEERKTVIMHMRVCLKKKRQFLCKMRACLRKKRQSLCKMRAFTYGMLEEKKTIIMHMRVCLSLSPVHVPT